MANAAQELDNTTTLDVCLKELLHNAGIARSGGLHVPRRHFYKRLTAALDETHNRGNPICVIGTLGTGKSTVMADLVLHAPQRLGPKYFVAAHFFCRVCSLL